MRLHKFNLEITAQDEVPPDKVRESLKTLLELGQDAARSAERGDDDFEMLREAATFYIASPKVVD